MAVKLNYLGWLEKSKNELAKYLEVVMKHQY